MTFERDYVRKKTLDTIKQLTKHMYHPQLIHWVIQVAIIPIFRYSAAIASWDSQEIVKLENLWMRAFKKAWKVNASLPVHILKPTVTTAKCAARVYVLIFKNVY